MALVNKAYNKEKMRSHVKKLAKNKLQHKEKRKVEKSHAASAIQRNQKMVGNPNSTTGGIGNNSRAPVEDKAHLGGRKFTQEYDMKV